jgi:predicted cation transporter
VAIALVAILIAVLLGPVLIKPIEHNLELFFLVLGVVAAMVGGQFGWPMVRDGLTEPIGLTLAVLVFGAVARVMRPYFDDAIQRMRAAVSPRWIYFTLIIVLGMVSSIITAVVAALLLVEAIAMLRLDRPSETAAVIIACFAIGMGAGLTPIGEPLGAIATAALRADFWYLMRLLGPIVIPGIVLVSVLSLFIPPIPAASLYAARPLETWKEIILRGVKIYAFVFGLVGLSWGMRGLVGEHIRRLPQAALFWINSISAVVDNATLTAAEIGPSLSPAQQRAILMGLLISGGMLIPGNIPNIVAANRLGISSRQWARIGLMVGLPLMALCFITLYLAG